MLHCNCSFNICDASFIIHKQRVKEEWMQTWKIRISWNIKQNSISGAFVFDSTIWFRIFHLDHFQLLLNGYRAKLLMERKLSEKDDRSASYTSEFEMNFSITIFFCKKLEQGIGTLEKNGCWLFVWFTRRDRLISSECMCCTTTLLSWMFSSFQIFNFFS
jgi:hypothetical protein